MTSKYTCKTCTNTECDLHADNPGNINEDTGDTYGHFHWYYSIIDKKGCASHSDFQSERDKVLPVLEELIAAFHEYEMDVSDPEFAAPPSHGKMIERAEALVKELRGVGEP